MGISKPSSKSNWTVGNSSFATVTQEPNASKKQTGWQIDERPAREWMNWLFYITDQWVDYFEDPSGQIEEIDNADSPYSASSLNRWLAVDTSAGNVTINLPVIIANSGARFTIVKKSNDTNTVIIDGDGAETINGALTQILRAQYECIVIKEVNGEWAVESRTTKFSEIVNVSSTQDVTSDDLGKTLLVDTTGGAVSLNLPAPFDGAQFRLKDKTGSFGTNAVTLVRNGSEEIEGSAADFVFNDDWGELDIFSDGTDWFFASISRVNTEDIVDNAVTPAKRSTNIVKSLSSGTFSTSSSSYVDVTNLSVTITTSGNPVRLWLQSDGTSIGSIRATDFQSSEANVRLGVDVRLLRDATTIAELAVGVYTFDTESGATGRNTEVVSPLSTVYHLDEIPAGTYTFKVQIRKYSDNLGQNSANVTDAILVAEEL